MIIYMYKEKGIGYIYAFFNGHGYTCQCRVNASYWKNFIALLTEISHWKNT